MITIPLSTEDLAKVRLAPSPLWETGFSFWVLMHPDRHTLHAPWATRARRVLPGTDLSPLLALMCVKDRCPGFPTPPPDASLTDFGEELERLRATPPEVVHEEVELLVREEKQLFGRLLPEQERLLGVYLKDPEGSLKRLVDTLRRYHNLAIAPYWPKMRELLEGDTVRRGQALALGGVEALLSGLNPQVSYSGAVLEVDKPCEVHVETAGRGITLVPCAFSWPKVTVLTGPHLRPTLAYAPPRGGEPMDLLVSCAKRDGARGRLGRWPGVCVEGPRTTTELARQLYLSPAAVSAHLSRLKVAGLV
jgi:Family of unknown function (DUF5937)/Bacterial regulatory protein, arsR family